MDDEAMKFDLDDGRYRRKDERKSPEEEEEDVDEQQKAK